MIQIHAPCFDFFEKERGEYFSELEDPGWLQDFAFLDNITVNLIILNLQPQGSSKNKDIGGTNSMWFHSLNS